MDQHALKHESGAVVFELILVMPLVLMILVFVLECDRAIRSSWCSQGAVRLAAWSLNRTEAMPGGDALAEVLQRMDPRVTSCDLVPENLGGASRVFDESIRSLASSLPGSLWGHLGGDRGADGAEARAHLGAKWGETTHRCVLDARSWTAFETGIGGSDFREAGEEKSAPAWASLPR